MLIVFLVLLLVGFVLSALLWLGSLWLQGYVYNEPSEGLAWRAPAAGGAIMLFLAVWCLLDYQLATPGSAELPLDTLWSFSPTETYPATPWKSFVSVSKDGKETEYTRLSTGGVAGVKYVDNSPQRRPWSRDADGLAKAVIIPLDDQKVRFDLIEPAGGKFQPGEVARYKEEDGQGRVLTEDDIRYGQMSRFRLGLFIGNILFNLLYLAVWFVCVWLLLRFQWSHALGLAVVLWLVTSFVVVPTLLSRVKDAKKAAATPTAGHRRLADAAPPCGLGFRS